MKESQNEVIWLLELVCGKGRTGIGSWALTQDALHVVMTCF